jgi:hypothetical protein
MPSSEHAEVVVDVTSEEMFADVDELSDTVTESYYMRNSGLLPRLESATASDYGRAVLPSPIAAEPDTIVTRVKDLISARRPAWRS